MSKRHAILISNSKYKLSDYDLDTPDNDIASVEHSVISRGFTVEKHYNVNADDFEKIFEILSKGNDFDLILVYYSGHAIEIRGKGYLLPVDLYDLNPFLVASFVFGVDKIIKSLENASKNKIIVLDSCRNGIDGWSDNQLNEFESAIKNSLDSNMNYQGVAIAYSTSSGEKAYDGIGISHYARNLSEQMLQHRINIDDVFKNVGALVTKIPPHNQRPWFYSSLNESLTFSDLPEYHYINTVITPISGINTNLQCLNGQQVIFGEHVNVYSLNDSLCQPILGFDENIVDLDYSPSTSYVLATIGGGVISESFSFNSPIDNESLVCIKISPDGRLTALIGPNKIAVLDNVRRKSTVINSDQDNFYSARFIDNKILWVGAVNGLKVITFRDTVDSVSDINIEGALYIYSIEQINDGIIALSCSGGNIIYIDKNHFHVIGNTFLGKTVRTISARRGSVFNLITDSETMDNFIYKPWLIDKEGLDLLMENLSANDIMYIKSSPIDPILLAASDEGVVYFIDRRDFKMYHSINITTSNNRINGISFDEKGTVIILTGDGNVHYYSRGQTDQCQAIKYIDDMYD
ncbi:caspase family protein [Pantoea sp. DY-15]|uniref:caspase family protein n=1 Tax=Pantoea sp. DY-15 TaxID=2871489 RepID=UPI001C949108|nr:caspase family protein [Pantoea sp. DY-15]MBY4890718.1 caspase family protein [Pantoea sp. DY-15]